MKQKLLYLCHRIPYPPNKGDKIPAYHILKFLNKHFDVYLGCFIDDPFDNRYREHVQSMCKEVFFAQINPRASKIKSLSGLLYGEPLTLPYYKNQQMFRWVNRVMDKHQIDKAFLFSGCMAQYLMDSRYSSVHKVMHFVDVDSDKWGQYAENSTGLMRWVYKREQRTLADYEKHVAQKCAVNCFVSDSEASMFRNQLHTDSHKKVQSLSNGIDSDYFSPYADSLALSENYPLEEENYIVFTGAMDYRPNIDGVVWFAENVWPQIRKNVEDSRFYIVGSSPSKQVQSLAKIPGIVVTGRVEDIRPYMLNAKASVAPILIARGIQNKILEAMSMERPVITTELGIEGIDNYPDEGVSISSSPETIVRWVSEKLTKDFSSVPASRKWLMEHYSWNARLSPLLEYLGSRSD